MIIGRFLIGMCLCVLNVMPVVYVSRYEYKSCETLYRNPSGGNRVIR